MAVFLFVWWASWLYQGGLHRDFPKVVRWNPSQVLQWPSLDNTRGMDILSIARGFDVILLSNHEMMEQS